MKTFKRIFGDKGEEKAVKYLIENKYIILDRNYSSKYGEIDIICKKDNIICFVEVKTRKSLKYGYASESVNYKKQIRILNTAKIYCTEKNLYDNFFRFDVCEIYSNGEINYIENAFYE
ncbi:MAG: YraN family protein [Peptoniphilaceae bacterium]|nr:YraN family protein [Peptoniphilaceae bacterium]MDD7383146.1 YraN family protein [Peptoniphilaceae bacterium]MDY3738123.1 YraN family protein [Peptoniphilaceae bacterium]